MEDSKTTLKALKKLIKNFVDERDWSQFHSPKNLSMSISIEAAELMEIFQWVSLEEANDIMKSGEKRENAVDEIADVLIYAISFCESNNIDISDAICNKMEKNIVKYPVEKYKSRF